MKRSRFGGEQIISILHEQEVGSSTAEVCREHGVSSATFYKWKAAYGGVAGAQATTGPKNILNNSFSRECRLLLPARRMSVRLRMPAPR